VTFTLRMPLARMGMADAHSYRVTDLWTRRTETLSPRRLAAYRVRVPRDKSAGGGVRALRIVPAAARANSRGAI
jgi:hypothetical protein